MGPQKAAHLTILARNLSRQNGASLAAPPVTNYRAVNRLRLRLRLALIQRLSETSSRACPSPATSHSELIDVACDIAELTEIDAELAALAKGRRADSCRLAQLLGADPSGRRFRPQTPKEDERETREFFGFLPGDTIT